MVLKSNEISFVKNSIRKFCSSPVDYLELNSTAKEYFVFTESSETYKILDESSLNSSGKLNLNCAHFNNAEFKSESYVYRKRPICLIEFVFL